MSAEELRSNLEQIFDDFIKISFSLHPKAISETANRKIRDGEVILTFSHSSLVERVLLDAAAAGKKVEVSAAKFLVSLVRGVKTLSV